MFTRERGTRGKVYETGITMDSIDLHENPDLTARGFVAVLDEFLQKGFVMKRVKVLF